MVATSTVLTPIILAALLYALQTRIAGPDPWIWAGAMVAVLLVRSALLLKWKLKRPPLEHYPRWGWYYFVSMAVTMGAWGSLAPLFMYQLDPIGQAFVACAITGLVGASIIQVSTQKIGVLVVPTLTLAELLVGCAMVGGETMVALEVLVLCYLVYLIKVGLEHHKSQRDAVWLRFERAALAENLRAARDTAELANEAKSAFLANVSHELRTPLNAVIGFSEMIKLGILGKEPTRRQTEYAGMIHESGTHLLDLINDLLDLSKAEAGQLNLHEEKVSLHASIKACIQLLAPAAGQAGVAVDWPDATVPDICVRADERRMRQILINLMSNAMKFTPRGGRVRVAYARDTDGGLTLSVADTGTGMTPHELNQAMLPFVQVGDVYNKQVQGTGLGLPLVKQLVELHGGHLSMVSAPGSGTTATIHFPAERVEDPPASRAVA